MNCREFDERCLAYLDGELETEEAARIESHLASCAECRGMAEADRRLKSSLARILAKPTLPNGFADRAFAPLESRAFGGSRRAMRFIPFGVVSAAAACLLLWLGYPAVFPKKKLPDAGGARTAREFAEAVWKLHVRCVAMGAAHQRKDLPRDDLAGIGRQMTDELHVAVLAPDWDQEGLRLVGADYCPLLGARVAHLIYQNAPDNVPLSLISSGAMNDRFPGEPETEHNGRRYFAASVFDSCVVAWPGEGPASYILCARMDRDSLLNLADPLRLAVADTPRPIPIGNRSMSFPLASMGRKSPFGLPLRP